MFVLQQVTEALFGVLFDQIKHALRQISATVDRICSQDTDLQHDRFIIPAFDISKRHLCTFVVVDPQLRVVNEWDLVQRHYIGSRYVNK